MFHPNTLRFLEWWRGLPQVGGVPARASVEPAALARVLPQVFILAEDLSFRLAGGLVCDLHGRELRDRAFAPLWDRPDQGRLAAALERAVVGREPVIVQADAHPLTGAGVGLQITMAPLASRAGGAADRLIGLYQPTSMLARLRGRPVQTLSIRRVHPEPAANDARLRLVAVDGRRIA
jgi:hypothetical protein